MMLVARRCRRLGRSLAYAPLASIHLGASLEELSMTTPWCTARCHEPGVAARRVTASAAVPVPAGRSGDRWSR